MSIFELVKAKIPLRDAAEYYGFQANRQGMIRCPFHDDHTPSLKLNRDYFYCFGCGAHGDVIEFAARLFGLSNLQAAKKLAYDFGLDPDKPAAAAALKKSRFQMEKKALELEKNCQRIVCGYLHMLEDWKERYAPSDPEDEWDSCFVEACKQLDYVEYLADILTFGESEERRKTAQMLQDNETIIKWKACMRQAEKEECDYGEKKAA